MSIKASASVTLSSYRDTEAVTRYYKLVSSTSSAPSKPTTNPPSGWDDTEPSYTSGSTNTLYFCDLTKFSDGTWAYSAVSKSSSYEAAKEAYNKAQNAQDTANSANGKIDGLEIGGRNLLKKYIRTGGGCSKIDDSTIKVGTTVGDTYFYLRSHCALTAGETYTISCEASNVPDGCNWSFGVRNEHGTWQLYINKNGKNFATGVLDTDIGADSDFILDDMYGKPSTAPNIILTNFKLEKGNKATDWTPAPEDVDAAINAKISSVDVEYYLSTSSTSLSGGSWQTTAPTWVDGKYMWSRTKITDGAGNVTYSPSQNGTCIAGAKGSTGATGSAGTGISSITEEYYLSTSKTSQTGGEWSTTPPTWSSGKYIWTRSKIVYTNPSSTVYTTPVCDSSWEAVNEIEVGGRNLLLNTGNLTKWTKEPGISVTPDSDGWYKITDSLHTTNRWGIYQDFSGYEQNTDYTVSLYLKKGSNIGHLWIGYGGWGSGVIIGSSTKTKYSYTFNTGSNTAALRIYINLVPTAAGQNFYVKLPKLEKGNKATDWTPAPEDMVDKANIVSCINQTPESITIQANKISLEGLITANSNFKILSDGSMETIAGKIGGWSIGNNKIYSENQYNTDNIYGDSDYSYHEYTEGTKSVSLVSDNSNNGEVISVLYDYLTWTSDDTENKTPSTQYVKIFDDGRLKIGTEGIWADNTPSIDTTEISGSYITLTENDQENFTCLITPKDIQFVSSIGDSVSVMSSIYEQIWDSGKKSPFNNVVAGSSMWVKLCQKGKLVTGTIYSVMAVGAANYYYTLDEFLIPVHLRPNENIYVNTINHAAHSLTYGTSIFVITPEGRVGIKTSNAGWLERHACFSYWTN